MSTAVEVVFPLGVLSLAVTGALIASRYPRHMVTWWFLLAALVGELVLAFRSYGAYGAATVPGGVPAATSALALSSRSRVPRSSKDHQVRRDRHRRRQNIAHR